jgi:hypothetical protein
MIATAFAQTSPSDLLLYDFSAVSLQTATNTPAAAPLLLSKVWRSDGALLILLNKASLTGMRKASTRSSQSCTMILFFPGL